MQKKMDMCQAVVPGSGEGCDCPVCSGNRVRENIARMTRMMAERANKNGGAPKETAAEALKPKKDFKSVTVKIPPTSRDTERAEERAREPVKSYLLTDIPDTAWDDIVGADEARAVLRQALEAPVKHPELYRHYGMTMPRGVLLEGPPGCGKTMYAKAAARCVHDLYGTGRPAMLKINGPEIQTPFVGATEKIIRKIFAYARAYHARYGAPLLIFVDEADAILPARDGFNGRTAQPWEESTVASFLTEMDGIAESGAFVMLATNRPHAMDAAVLRPGRVDVKVRVPRPNRDACVGILTHSLRSVPLAHTQTLKAGGAALRQQVPAHTVDVLAARAVDLLLSPVHTLVTMQSDVGPLHLTMAHIVSGALVVELGNRAKGCAFKRDLAAGTVTGLTEPDFTAAVYALVQESERGTYPDAVRDLCIKAGATMAHNGPGETDFDEEHLTPFQTTRKPKDSKPN